MDGEQAVSAAYWRTFYSDFVAQEPSLFAKFVSTQVDLKYNSVIDFGCGNLRDANFFGSLGANVLGLDQVDSARFVRPDLVHNVSCRSCDLGQRDVIDHVKAFTEAAYPGQTGAYARFFMHALDPVSGYKFLRNILGCRQLSWYAFEFRTLEDEGLQHQFGGHARYFVDMSSFLDVCNSYDDLRVVHVAKSTGLSPFGNEDPVVGRVMLLRDKPELVGPSGPTGRVESVGEHEISGWVAGGDGDRSPVVTLKLSGRPIVSTRANLVRADLAGLRGNPTGFRFPIGESLRGIVRKGAAIQVVYAEQPIPFVTGVSARTPFGAQYNDEVMRLVLDGGGYSVSAKHGALYKPIGNQPQFQERALEACRRVRTHLKAVGGVEFTIAFGTLLGLRRDGRLIAHDDDCDGLVVLAADNIAEFLDKYKALLQSLRESNCQVELYSDGVHFSLVVEAGDVPMDCFVAWFDGTEVIAFNTAMPCKAEDLAPVEMERFEGVFAPAATEALLEHWYGPGWGVLDPYFQWEIPPRRRVVSSAFAQHVEAATRGFLT